MAPRTQDKGESVLAKARDLADKQLREARETREARESRESRKTQSKTKKRRAK